MLKIGFCDDDLSILKELQVLLDHYRVEKNRELVYTAYQSPLELLADMEKGLRFDILFLDVLMPGQTGMEAAREIREFDTAVKIIFLTSSAEFAVESYTVGSHEFYMNYAAKNDLVYLIDNGHFHPTESCADKLSSLLLFSDKVALHLTRGVRWDSDHVIALDDSLKEMCREIVACDALDRVIIGSDYFDASINRISAWTVGFRNVEKALLSALCTPHTALKELQDTNQFTELMVRQEELKTLPFGEVWDEYCRRNGVPVDGAWFEEVKKYEQNVLSKRI